MAYVDYSEMIKTAKELFMAGDYTKAEPLLKQLLLVKNLDPEVYQMLATIYYDQGKFKRAIQTFKRALEIDPNYTDASIGLSIILNDIGKYEEGTEVFQKARKLLDEKKSRLDSYAEEKICQKHTELADLYFNYRMYKEAIEQLEKALKFSRNKSDICIKIADNYIANKQVEKAVLFLHKHLEQYPEATGPRLKLGLIYYNGNRILEASEQWEKVLKFEPQHSDAKAYIKLAQKAGLTELPL